MKLIKKESKIFCFYCNEPLKKWRSKWEGEIHYKSSECDCGSINMVRVDFHGSGHDDWHNEVEIVFDGEESYPENEFEKLVEKEASKLKKE